MREKWLDVEMERPVEIGESTWIYIDSANEISNCDSSGKDEAL